MATQGGSRFPPLLSGHDQKYERYRIHVHDDSYGTITDAVWRARANAVRDGFAEPMRGNKAGPATYALLM